MTIDITININRALDKFYKRKKNIWICQTYFKSKKNNWTGQLYFKCKGISPWFLRTFPKPLFRLFTHFKISNKKIISLKTVRLWLSISWQSVNYNINKWNTTKNDKNAIVHEHFGQPSYLWISVLSGYFMFNMPLDLNCANLY